MGPFKFGSSGEKPAPEVSVRPQRPAATEAVTPPPPATQPPQTEQRSTLKVDKETMTATAPQASNTTQSRTIKTLPFVDLYLRLDAEGDARFNPMARKGMPQGNLTVPDAYREDIERLRQQILPIKKDDFSVIHESVRLRGARRRIANGQTWCALRRVSDQVPSMEELRFNPALVPHLRNLGRRTGLIIVSGATGHGKTTTVTSLLSDYLRNFGELAYTLEDPVEYQIQGEYGRGGFCFQTEVDRDDDWATGLKSALRWHPRYLLVGEIRSPDAANQVLRAATSGHLVLTTMHAGSIQETLNALIQIAELALGNRATQLLADGLIGVLHQTLRSWGPFVRFLITEPDNGGDPIRACIRDNKIEQLGTYIEQQELIVFGPNAYEQRIKHQSRA